MTKQFFLHATRVLVAAALVLGLTGMGLGGLVLARTQRPG